VAAPKLSVLRDQQRDTRIPVGLAALTWLGSWLAGNLLAALVIGASGESTGDVDTPVWLTLVSATALWIPMLFALREVSLRFGVGTFRDDYGLRFKPIDLLGLPIGVACQLALLRAVYWPLEEGWPETFSRERLEKTARTLSDSAEGVWVLALGVVIIIGAPFVEELMFRGLLQGAFVRRINDVIAVVLVAAWFALIHFRPVEYPGLFVFGLVLGVCALVTRRIGMSIAAHVAFNATGLILVASRVS
jgi:membrane protease YdiL (CAAX protease family)